MSRTLPHSLLGRLVIRVLTLTVILVLAIIGILLYTLYTSVDTLRDRSLQGQGLDVARHLSARPDGSMSLALPEALATLYADSTDTVGYAVVDGSGSVLFASPGVTAPLTSLASDAPELFRDRLGDTGFFGYSLPWSVGDRTVRVQVRQSDTHEDVLIDSVVEELLENAGWLIFGFTASLLLVIFLTIRQGLAPLRIASAQAREIGPGSLDSRLPLGKLPNEVTPLVEAVNGALDRLAEGYRLQREFTANAAHELNTPLAVLRANIETSNGQDEPERLLHDVDRLSRVVHQLLRIAELEAPERRHLGDADLTAVAIDIATFMAPMALAESKTIEVLGDRPNPVQGDEVALGHAVRNLVENALLHAPPGTIVTIDASRPGRIQVTDRGPGVPQDYREDIFRRFWRPPDHRTRTGAGLGLSIVSAVAESHHGTVSLCDTPAPGACFEIALPTPSKGLESLGIDHL